MITEINIDDIIAHNIISDRNNKDSKSPLNIDNSVIELSKSIKAQGLLHPIVVKKEGDKYRIVCGQRRILAFKMLGYSTIKATIKEFNDFQDELLSIIDENNIRKNLNPYEKFLSQAKVIYILMNKESVSISNIENVLGDKYELVLFFNNLLNQSILKNTKKPYDKKYDLFETLCGKININARSLLGNRILINGSEEILNLLKEKKISFHIACYLQSFERDAIFNKIIKFAQENHQYLNVNLIKAFIKREKTKEIKNEIKVDKDRFMKILETKDPKMINYLNSLVISLEKKINSKNNKK